MAKMNEKFLQVIKDPGPATIVTVDGNPAHVVNTWSQYIKVIDDHTLLIPAAGMHSIEGDIDKGKNELTITVGSFKVPGTEWVLDFIFMELVNSKHLAHFSI